MVKKIIRFFDKLEDRIRGRLSHTLIIYAFISGFGIVLFWKGIWDTADLIAAQGGIWYDLFYGPGLAAWATVILLATGVFVSFFVGDRVILSGIKHEKKIEEKTEEELKADDARIKNTVLRLEKMEQDIDAIKHALNIQ